MRKHSLKRIKHSSNNNNRELLKYKMLCTDQSYKSNIVGISLGRAVFNCVRVMRPTICPSASTDATRT